MIKHFTATFLKGFLALLPLLLSIYILIWLLTGAETVARELLLFFLPDSAYLPGLGILAAIIFIYCVGILMGHPSARRIMGWVEGPFQIVPILRTVYTAIKDFTSYLTPNKKRSGRVVVVQIPGSPFEMVGLVTRESTKGLPAPLETADKIAVYFPMSYQFGGYTAFVPRSAVKEFGLGTEQTMRSVLTAWVSGQSVRDDSNN